jgi:hypothetical protein
MTNDKSAAAHRPLERSRWAAVGAAVAVTIGAGGMLQAKAAGNDSTSPAVFVATTPCRLMDTRPAPDAIGPRSTPLSADDTYTTSVTGSRGRCTIPSDATTLVMNVTAVNQNAPSFLTVYAAGTERPVTSSLNWDGGSGTTANAVTANISASGEMSFYNMDGQVDVIADVVGYYTSAPLDGFYTKAQIDAMISANPGAVGPKGDTGEQGDVGPAGDGVAAAFYLPLYGYSNYSIGYYQGVYFPVDGPATSDGGIFRSGYDGFSVAVAGLYRVTYQVPIEQAGQLGIAINNQIVPHTGAGRETGDTQIVGDSLVLINPGDVLQIVNSDGYTNLNVSGVYSGYSYDAAASLIIELVEPTPIAG